MDCYRRCMPATAAAARLGRAARGSTATRCALYRLTCEFFSTDVLYGWIRACASCVGPTACDSAALQQAREVLRHYKQTYNTY